MKTYRCKKYKKIQRQTQAKYNQNTNRYKDKYKPNTNKIQIDTYRDKYNQNTNTAALMACGFIANPEASTKILYFILIHLTE